jgi:glutamate---cysteine ligase / carboxylate-amine ligase
VTDVGDRIERPSDPRVVVRPRTELPLSVRPPGVRTVGVEEELLVIDPRDGRPLPLADALLQQGSVPIAARRHLTGEPSRPPLDTELQQEQVETASLPHTDLHALRADLHRLRMSADAAARSVGARVAAIATSPLPVTPQMTRTSRYLTMREEFGITCAEQLTCGCHVHVAVASDEEGVAVLDRIRAWLPVLVAIASNSPYWKGVDTGYAGYRTQAWSRWPGTGPTDVLGSAAAYHDLVRQMLATGSLLDEGMVYFDARLSRRYPTVEVRVADVCTDVEDAVLVAALCRALVDTAAAEWRAGVPPAAVATPVLRLATWRASRSGLDGELVDPVSFERLPARDVVESLVDHVRPALVAVGDLRRVEAGVQRVLARGSGARRQRQVMAVAGRLAWAVLDAADRTLE